MVHPVTLDRMTRDGACSRINTRKHKDEEQGLLMTNQEPSDLCVLTAAFGKINKLNCRALIQRGEGAGVLSGLAEQ